MLNENQVHTIKHYFHRMISAVKWIIFSIISGLVIGAAGMISLFCGVTNCPITSLLLSFELFGYAGRVILTENGGYKTFACKPADRIFTGESR